MKLRELLLRFRKGKADEKKGLFRFFTRFRKEGDGRKEPSFHFSFTPRIILYSFIAAAAVTALMASGALKRVDRWAQDSLYQRGGVPDTDIIVIGIDDLAFDFFGPYNTWDRNIMASALEKLAADPEKKPAVVAVDILYAGNSSPTADERLAAAAEELGCVITASMATFGEEIQWEDGRAVSLSTSAVIGYEEPYEALKNATTQGHINAMYDTDGIMRHALLYADVAEGRRVYSMPWETAKAFCEAKGLELKMPAANAAGHIYIPYTAKPGGYSDGVSIAMLIAGKVPADYWAGKIVLIGPYATALQDAYFTPIMRAEQMNGIEIQANVIQSLLEGQNKTEPGDTVQLILLFLICGWAVMFYLQAPVLHGGILCAGLAAAGPVLAIVLYRFGIVTHPLWLASAAIVLYIVSLAAHYVTAARERRALELEKERIGAELSLATRIQSSALIHDFPAFPDRKEFELYASMTPAKEVGGDLYDFFMPDEDHLAVAIGDVSGKGFPAALFMMVAMTLLRHVAMREPSPAKALAAVNEEICARNPEEMFVTMWLGMLEISTGRMICANAGHEYPAMKKPDGSFELYKDRHGFVVGGMQGVRYREYEIQMEPGTKLYVYTDGVPEATNAAKEMFGAERMVETLQTAETRTPKEIADVMIKAVMDFTGDAPQFDDVTRLCLQYNGKGYNGKVTGNSDRTVPEDV